MAREDDPGPAAAQAAGQHHAGDEGGVVQVYDVGLRLAQQPSEAPGGEQPRQPAAEPDHVVGNASLDPVDDGPAVARRVADLVAACREGLAQVEDILFGTAPDLAGEELQDFHRSFFVVSRGMASAFVYRLSRSS